MEYLIQHYGILGTGIFFGALIGYLHWKKKIFKKLFYKILD